MFQKDYGQVLEHGTHTWASCLVWTSWTKGRTWYDSISQLLYCAVPLWLRARVEQHRNEHFGLAK